MRQIRLVEVKSTNNSQWLIDIGKLVLCLAFGLLMGWLTSLWALPAAYAERGYEAFGSEWLLIFLVGWTGYILMYKLVRR